MAVLRSIQNTTVWFSLFWTAGENQFHPLYGIESQTKDTVIQTRRHAAFSRVGIRVQQLEGWFGGNWEPLIRQPVEPLPMLLQRWSKGKAMMEPKLICSHVRPATQSHLTEYSSQGLRTLVVAARDLTDEELSEWQCKYEDASASLTDRSVKLRQTAAFIECKLNLLGDTRMRIRLPLWTFTKKKRRLPL